jgi:hypothetical protein
MIRGELPLIPGFGLPGIIDQAGIHQPALDFADGGLVNPDTLGNDAIQQVRRATLIQDSGTLQGQDGDEVALILEGQGNELGIVQDVGIEAEPGIRHD